MNGTMKIENPMLPDLRLCEVSKPYFHEASQEDIDKLMESDVTWKEIIDRYSQPEWCNYPDALSGQMGCWSLIDTEPEGLRTKISKEFCKSCPECK